MARIAVNAVQSKNVAATNADPALYVGAGTSSELPVLKAKYRAGGTRIQTEEPQTASLFELKSASRKIVAPAPNDPDVFAPAPHVRGVYCCHRASTMRLSSRCEPK